VAGAAMTRPSAVETKDDGFSPGYRGPAIWAAFVVAAFAVGAALRAAGALPVDPFAPLHAHARSLVAPLIPAAVVALAGVAGLPTAARRMRWRPLLLLAWAASALWAVALQWHDGLSRPLTARTEYLAGLPAVGDEPLAWLRGFTRHLQEYPTHVKATRRCRNSSCGQSSGQVSPVRPGPRPSSSRSARRRSPRSP
jgi:hypothetical protein